MMKQNYKIRGNTRRTNKNHTYLLGGLVYCAHCQVFLESGSGTSNSNGCYYYYRHPKTSQKQDCPHPTSLPVGELEDIVSRQILGLLDDEDLIDMVCDEVMTKITKDIKSTEEQIAVMDSQINDLNKESGGLVQKIAALDEDQIKEFISPKLSELSERKKGLTVRREELELELQDLRDQAISPDDIRYTVACLAARFDDLKPRQKQRIMRILVEKVELYPKQVMVFLRVAKKNPRELSDRKFEEIPSWLPR